MSWAACGRLLTSQCVVWGGGEKSGKLQKVRGGPAP